MGVKERYKNRNSENSAEEKKRFNGVKERWTANNINDISDNLTSRINTWIESSNNYIANYQNRLGGRTGTYKDSYVSDSDHWMSRVDAQRRALDREAESIKKTLSQYGDYFNSDWLDEVTSVFDKGKKTHESIVSAATSDRDYWAQWDEESYGKWQRESGYADKYKGKKYDELNEILGRLDEGTDEHTWLSDYVPTRKWGEHAEATDFDQYSSAGASIKNPTYMEAQGNIFKKKQDVGNIVTFSRENKDAIAFNADNYSQVGTWKYNLMTDDEVNMYNYLLSKYGSDKATEYLTDIDETLNERHGEFIKSNIDDIDSFLGRTVTKGVFSLGAGIDQAVSGLRQAVTAKDLPTTPTAFANQAIMSELDGVGKYAYQAGNTIGNMLPSIAVSALTGSPAAGAAMMGVSSSGNAYSQARDEGYDEGQARLYGALVGASEGALQYALGGISKLSGASNVMSKVTAKTALIDNALLRVAAKYGTSLSGEIVEEELQNFLEPLFKTVIFGEEYDAPTIEELLETAIVTALSTGVLESGGIIGGEVNNRQYKDTYGEVAPELVTEALEIDPSNTYAQKVQARLDAGKSITGNQIANLIEQNEAAMAAGDVTAIETAARERLTALGETGDVAAISTALAKQASGEKLGVKERSLVKNSKFGQRVANELNVDNIKSGQYSSSWAESIGTNRINADEYNRLEKAAEVDGGVENAVETTAEAALPKSYTPETTTPVEGEKTASTEAVDLPEIAEPTEPATDTNVPTTEKGPEQIENAEEVRETANAADTNVGHNEPITIEEASQAYGKHAEAMRIAYNAGDGSQDVVEFDAAYKVAYDMGKSGVPFDYVTRSEATAYLNERQRELAYETGKSAADVDAATLDSSNKALANGKTGRKIGAVRGDGVTIEDLKATFNDRQNTAYKVLSTIAESTGIDIVLYKSDYTGAQGRYDRREPGTVYIDINAGVANAKSVNELAKYTMLRTFSHEFTHFIENWNPVRYNEFRKAVFDTLTERGEDVNGLIEAKMEGSGLSYDRASREVIAEAMTDILPDAGFVETLATKHKSIFEKLKEKLGEFLSAIKEYFNSIARNSSREANALKEQVGETVRYVESIVKLFDNVAVEAVENYQLTVAGDLVPVTAETETVEETVETEPEDEIEPYVSDNGYSLTDNANERTITITFDGKPSAEIRAVLKSNAFVWNRNKGEWFRSGKWYGKNKAEDVISALDGAYEAKPIDEKKEPTFTEIFENASQEEKDEVVEAINNNTGAPSHAFPTETHDEEAKKDLGQYIDAGHGDQIANEWFNHNKQEVTTNVEETGTVLPHRSDGQGDSRLLAESQTEDVQGDGAEWNAVDDSRERGNEAGRSDNRPDAEGSRGRSGEGDSESGDLRRDDGLTSHKAAKSYAEEKGYRIEINKLSSKKNIIQIDIYDKQGLPTFNPVIIGELGKDSDATKWNKVKEAIDARENAEKVKAESAEESSVTDEKLHEEVAEQIAEQSTEQPKGRNFVIGDSLDLPSGEKARYKANIEAIRLVKQLEAEGRYATEAEQTVLSKYVGWGGLANAFDQRKSEWAKEYTELKELLTKEEYELARGSTLNAHYTDISVIKAMYDGLAGLGFNGGRLLEPSSGVGNFVGAMPTEMSAKVKSFTMVELDGITGLIAKYLYPNADVRIQGFEKAIIPDNYMDVAISNVPFGNYPITDKAYPKKVTSAIHNYFFAKSLDKVRPGGIVMFITSSYTMNAKDSTVRRYIMQKADLLGAIRLPDSAFKGNAGTEVVTDIIVLKKRADNTPYAGEDFLEAPYKNISGYNGAYINSYFDAHPEMVLGTATMDGGMYRGNTLTYKPLEGKGSLGDQIREAFKSIKGKMEYPAAPSREKTNFAVERAGKKTKENGLVVKDGKVYQNKGGELVEQTVAKGAAERISGMLDIRDAARELMTYQQQGLNDTEIKKARTKLNRAYDAFVKKYGYINSQANKNAIKDDPDKFSIFALENYDSEKKTATKADIFSKNTIAPNRTVTSAKDVAEGLIVSINQTGGVDAALIARLTGKTEADVTRELIDSRKAFKTRSGGLEAAETYLSGNVRAKLRDAEALAMLDADYKNNVEALKSVMPEDVGYQDIFVNPGTPWIPNSVYSDFAAYMLGGRNTEWRQDVDITRNPETGNFTVELKNRYLKTNAANTQKWGTSRRSFLDLFDAMLNSKSVVIKDKLEDGSSVINRDATAAANEKIENIQKEFTDWLWSDEGRRGELATLYNEIFNSIVTPKYNGDNLTVNGANAMKPLRPHQRNAVQRVISSGGNTLLAHKVGAGKTYEMAAAAMKLKELGLVKKPMFAVPKSLVAQWGNEFMDFFPTAKLLVAEASDFTAANRKVFMNRIANGEYDAVIVSYEQFEKLPMSDDFTRELYQEQIDSVVAAIEEAKAEKGDKALSIKDLEKKRKSLQAKIDKLTDKAKDEDNIDFEQLGVDSLFVDEAHNFKNLFYTTAMTNVSGLGNKDGSKRAFDLYTKVRWLQQLNGGRGIVFATATPVMNSMSEMYIMQKYLQPDLINQLGLSTFDAWAKQFGEVVNGVEIKPSGQGYRVKQSFSRFKNMSELQLLFRNFADVLTDIPGLKIPKMKGGRVNVVVCEPGQFQQEYMEELAERAENVKNVDPSVDNMLKITSDGRKISYTQRMIDPSLPYEEGCKIYRCADNVVRAYNESADIKGTQLIFCDMATPKGKSNTNENATEDIETDNESAQLYDDIKARLIKNGIPAKEIAFIHEADTDAKKKKLFADVNDGKVRVLIGSTGKMGVGMNAQKRVVAIHHLDAPWRPGDVEQRNGRAFRQGNINDEVECFTYVTEGSFDARLWDILERKQNFINQIMNGDSVGREAEDTGEVTLSAAEVKALASGSPLILEQVQLDTDIKKLESLYRAHLSAIRSAKARLLQDEGTVATLEKCIEAGRADLSARVDTYTEGKFSIKVGKTTFTDKKDAGAALMAAAIANAATEGYTTIGSFAGFDIRVIKTSEGIKGLLSGRQGYSFNTYPERPTYMITHLSGVAESIEEKIKLWEHQLGETQADIREQEKLIAEPFTKEAELESKRARYNEVMAILNPKEEQSLDSVDEDDGAQYQERSEALTDREVLEIAASEIEGSLTDGERSAYEIFQKRLEKLRQLEEERAEQGRIYRENTFVKGGDKKAAEEAHNRMGVLNSMIQKANEDILSVEDKAVLRRVLVKARKVVEDAQRAHDNEKIKRLRERQKEAIAVKKYRERIKADTNELSKWILRPDGKDAVKRVPDALKNAVIPFLTSIDFTSAQQLRGGDATKADQEFAKRLVALQGALKKNVDINGLYSGYNDLPPDFLDNLQNFVNTVQTLAANNKGEYVINKMTAEELRDLSKIVKTLKKFIMQINRFHANAMYQHVYEAADNSIEYLAELAPAKGTGAVSNFMLWQQMRPAYAFERFGRGGIAIYDGLRRGQSKLAFNTKDIKAFAESAYTEAEVKAWEKETKAIKLPSGVTVRMNVSQIMGLYELSKQEDSLRHMLGGGIRVATFKNGKEVISDVGRALTEADISTIVSTLTQRQKEVADTLQKYMATKGAEWGNYVSMARFGEELFTNPQYYPINSDGRHLQAKGEEAPGAAALYALLNMSFTKSRVEGANNRIILYSIFDVFSNHMASMAQYNAMALPVLDALKWFNYQQVAVDGEGNRHVITSVREQMDRAYGTPEETKPGSGNRGYAESFVYNIIKAFNGTEAQGTPNDSLGLKSLHQYNRAQIAYNTRVVMQQPLAITRAGMLLDHSSIIKALKVYGQSRSKRQSATEEMRQHSGIAAWKELGFYDVNVSRGIASIIKHDESALDKITDFGMKAAENADIITWTAMWTACKEEVTKKQKLKPTDEGYFEAVTKLFEDVVYKTQVVDSILTKNEFMRDKGFFARSVGSFMSEPTTTASMLIDAYDKLNTDMQRGMNFQQAWRRNGKMIARTAYVYGMGAVLLAAVQAVADALRDDDEYKTFLEKWAEAFGGNVFDELMPVNKLPIISDFYEVSKELLATWTGLDIYGNAPQSVFMQWYDSLAKGATIMHDKIVGEDTNYTWYGGIYKLLQAVSGMTGLPIGAVTREVVTIWNNTIGAMAPSLKVKSYDAGEKANIKYAYADGYLTDEEATELLVSGGLVEDADEAYLLLRGWSTGESTYEPIYKAVKNGGDIAELTAELTSHGYTEKQIKSQIAEKVGAWYRGTDSEPASITKADAVSMLQKYTDYTNDEIAEKVNKWSAKVVTGIEYNDIDDKFLAGEITAARAKQMFKLYGGESDEDATAKVTRLSFVKENPELEDISSEAVALYNENCKNEGISPRVFYDAWKYKNATKGDDKKKKVKEYIYGLNLTAKQKRRLFSCFYKD